MIGKFGSVLLAAGAVLALATSGCGIDVPVDAETASGGLVGLDSQVEPTSARPAPSSAAKSAAASDAAKAQPVAPAKTGDQPAQVGESRPSAVKPGDALQAAAPDTAAVTATAVTPPAELADTTAVDVPEEIPDTLSAYEYYLWRVKQEQKKAPK